MTLARCTFRATVTLCVLLTSTTLSTAQPAPSAVCSLPILARFPYTVIPVYLDPFFPSPFRDAIVEAIDELNSVQAGFRLELRETELKYVQAGFWLALREETIHGSSAGVEGIVFTYVGLPGRSLATTHRSTRTVYVREKGLLRTLRSSTIVINAFFDYEWCQADNTGLCLRLSQGRWALLDRREGLAYSLSNVIRHELLHGLGVGTRSWRHFLDRTQLLYSFEPPHNDPKPLGLKDRACLYKAYPVTNPGLYPVDQKR